MVKDWNSLKKNMIFCEGCPVESIIGNGLLKVLLGEPTYNVCELMKISSHANNMYFILFFDVYTDLTWIIS